MITLLRRRIVAVPVELPLSWYVAEEYAPDFPWRTRADSLLTPDDHEAMCDSMVAIVEAFELLGAAA